jgi:non-specific serine/threonine protein kinase
MSLLFDLTSLCVYLNHRKVKVVTKICSTLQVPENPIEPEKQKELVRWLQPKNLLLILDNCEHLLNACSDLAQELLTSCPNLYILATSRRTFNIGAVSWEVSSLDLPPLSLPAMIEAFHQYSAVQFFEVYARRARRTFELSTTNAFAVAEICRRLDGIPLAIEFAAARTKTWSPQEIAARLKDRFAILIGTNSKAPAHQQTLRASMEWSYELLDEGERRLFRRLSVFVGGWTEHAAIAVCDEEGLGTTRIQVILAGLVDHSLIACSGDIESRFGMLETVQEYSRECREVMGEGNMVRGRHRDYFLLKAEAINRTMGDARQVRRLDELEKEYANLEQAMTFCREVAEGIEKGLRLAAALQEFWWTRGYVREGRKWYAAFLSHPHAHQCTRARASALNGAAVLARMQKDYVPARSLLEESVAIYRELVDHTNEIDDRLSLARACGNLGTVVWDQKEADYALELFQESLERHRELKENDPGIAEALGNLSIVLYEQGQYASARPRFEEILKINQRLKNPSAISLCLYYLGMVAYFQNHDASAHSMLAESLTMNRGLGNKSDILSCLEAFAGLACKKDNWTKAARLYGASIQLQTQVGVSLTRSPGEQAEFDRKTATARQKLGEEPFFKAWAEGWAMSLEQAVEYALVSTVP